jgi:hypothetical protein
MSTALHLKLLPKTPKIGLLQTPIHRPYLAQINILTHFTLRQFAGICQKVAKIRFLHFFENIPHLYINKTVTSKSVNLPNGTVAPTRQKTLSMEAQYSEWGIGAQMLLR